MLRKTYASYYVMASSKLADLQEVLRHKDPATFRIYAALFPDHPHKNKDLVVF